MPSTSTVFRWLEQYAGFSELYARAREIQADMLADEILEIADSEIDTNRARVMIDARKWLAGKLRPKKYGDRVELDHKVEGSPGMVVTVNVLPAPVTPPVLDAEVVKPALPSARQ